MPDLIRAPLSGCFWRPSIDSDPLRLKETAFSMFQLFRWLLSGAPPNPDKIAYSMSTPKQTIPGIISDRSIPYSPKEFLDNIKDNEFYDTRRDHTLRECRVVEVLHLRRESNILSGGVPHEIILVRYAHTVIDKDGATVGIDDRIAKFERLKNYQPETGSLQSVPLAPESSAACRNSKGKSTGNLDRVFVAQTIGQLARDYDVVATFTPDEGALNFVDCIVAAHYARMLFESLRLLAGTPTTQAGPVHTRAGMWLSTRMVTAEGRLMPEGRSKDLVPLVDGRGSARRDVVHDAIERDRAEDSRLLASVEPLREIQELIQVCRTETWAAIQHSTTVAYEHIHAADIKAARAEEEAARAEEEAARAKEEVARAKEEAARAEEKAARVEEEAARVKEDAARVKGNAARAKRDAAAESLRARTKSWRNFALNSPNTAVSSV
ncbi:hypothetical protein BD626DRAFT_538491 [Schizophyllum amplum]|uniref:Uncharacterized protein n=1 Tax=Schizophyllum amplum TaxID=97359 RepID=A0A550C847_9AGAR|nr:hypothetical protein BD626DRAFT_538491 [Auriculariopsis ampla]